MKISSAGLSIIKEFEGFRANAYRDIPAMRAAYEAAGLSLVGG